MIRPSEVKKEPTPPANEDEQRIIEGFFDRHLSQGIFDVFRRPIACWREENIEATLKRFREHWHIETTQTGWTFSPKADPEAQAG